MPTARLTTLAQRVCAKCIRQSPGRGKPSLSPGFTAKPLAVAQVNLQTM